MAIYHFRVKSFSRSAGKNAVASAAYRSGQKLREEATGEEKDYSRKQGVEHIDLVFPKDTPRICREELWNMAEQAENRKNSVVAREYEIALPVELPASERETACRELAEHIADRYRVAVDIAIHSPSKQGDERNHHAHLMTTTREYTPEGLGAKTRILDVKNTSSVEIEHLRETWAKIQNRALERVGISAQVSHQTLEEQGISGKPTVHLGNAITALERKGIKTRAGDYNQWVQKSRATVSHDLPKNTSKMSEKGGVLKNTVELSYQDAKLILEASATRIAVKPLKKFELEQAEKKKALEKRFKDRENAYSELKEQEPKKRFFEFRRTFEKRYSKWEKEINRLWREALDTREEIQAHADRTRGGLRKIEYQADVQAAKENPEALKVVKEFRAQEEERRRIKFQQEMERKRQRDKNRGMER